MSGPLVDTGATYFHLQGKAELLGTFFANKMAVVSEGAKIPKGGLRASFRNLTPRGKLRSDPSFNVQEIRLAVRDMPKQKGGAGSPLGGELRQLPLFAEGIGSAVHVNGRK